MTIALSLYKLYSGCQWTRPRDNYFPTENLPPPWGLAWPSAASIQSWCSRRLEPKQRTAVQQDGKGLWLPKSRTICFSRCHFQIRWQEYSIGWRSCYPDKFPGAFCLPWDKQLELSSVISITKSLLNFTQDRNHLWCLLKIYLPQLQPKMETVFLTSSPGDSYVGHSWTYFGNTRLKIIQRLWVIFSSTP